MDLLTELARLNLDPALLAKARDVVKQAAQSAVYQAEAQFKEVKIQKLTL